MEKKKEKKEKKKFFFLPINLRADIRFNAFSEDILSRMLELSNF